MKLCPECFTPLRLTNHKIFHCYVCPEGHGTLYPKGELERIAEVAAGIDDLEMKIWDDRDNFSVVNSHYKSPDGGELLLEIRDPKTSHIMVYGDPVTHSLWVHVGEEEKLVAHIKGAADPDSLASYMKLAAGETVKIFDDDEPLTEAAEHSLIALKLLGERVLRAMPHITL